MTVAVQTPERPRAGEELRNNLLVAAVFLVFLALGWLVKGAAETRALTFTGLDGALTVDYPAAWVTGTASEPGTLLEVYDVKALSTYHPTFRIQSRSLREGQSLFDAATALSMRRNQTLREYQELGSQETTLAGQSAIRVSYGYVADLSAGAGQASLPAVVQASDVIVPHGGQLLVFTAEAAAGSLERYQPAFDRILRSTRLK